MKKTGYLLMFVLVACFCNQKILAAIPLVELIAKPNPTQFVKTQVLSCYFILCAIIQVLAFRLAIYFQQ